MFKRILSLYHAVYPYLLRSYEASDLFLCHYGTVSLQEHFFVSSSFICPLNCESCEWLVTMRHYRTMDQPNHNARSMADSCASENTRLHLVATYESNLLHTMQSRSGRLFTTFQVLGGSIANPPRKV
jgi:hypothetical protein